MARVFLYAPIISYRSDFANLFQAVSVSLTPGLWTFPPSVCRPYQRQSKSKAKCTRGARPCLFLLSLIFRSADGRYTSRRIALRALPAGVCVALRAPLKGYRCKPSSCRSCKPCKMSCTSSRVSSSVSALSLASSMLSSVSIVIAVNKSSPCRCSASSSDSVTI